MAYDCGMWELSKEKFEMKGVSFCCPSRLDIVVLNYFVLKVGTGKSFTLIASGSSKSSVLLLHLGSIIPTPGRS